MKIFIPKYLHRISISRQDILNFVGAHPRITAILTALGILIVFSYMGRFFVHEVFAISSSSSSSSLVPAVDYVDKTPINNVPGTPHFTYVLCFCSCAECAKEFVPGNEASVPGVFSFDPSFHYFYFCYVIDLVRFYFYFFSILIA